MMIESMEEMITAYERGALSRRQLLVRLGALVTGLAGFARSAEALQEGQGKPTFAATELNHLAIRVTDVDRSQAWYRKHLGLTPLGGGHPRFLQAGHHFLALFQSQKPGLDHFCFTVPDYDPADAVKRLEQAKLEPTRREDRVYFRDPDNLEVQVAASNE